MIPHPQRRPLVLLAALALLVSSRVTVKSTQQLADGQAPNAAEWSPSEDSWNYWWSYSGISGPAYWGLLNLDWHMCDKGRRQSPINIETNRLVYDPHLSPLQLDNNLISGILHNDGHAIVFNASARRPRQHSESRQTAPAGTDTTGARALGSANTRQHFDHQAAATTETAARRRRELQANFTDNRLIRPLHEAEPWPSTATTRELGQKIDLSISQSEALDAKVGELSLSRPPAAEDGADSYDDGGGDGGGGEDQESPESGGRVEISGAGLSYSYRFEAIYFRFGLDDKQAGSEHLINSKWHSAELQIVAYNSLLYGSFHEAAIRPHGLLAISILVDSYEPSGGSGSSSANVTANRSDRVNSQLERLLVPLNEIRYRNQMAEVREFNLSALLPERSQFVTYEGSLSIPGCHESVDWLVLNRPLYITQSSLDLLRSISADEQKSDTASGTLIAGNLRPTQPINQRPIRTSIKPAPKVNNENPAACQRLWTRYDYRMTTSSG